MQQDAEIQYIIRSLIVAAVDVLSLKKFIIHLDDGFFESRVMTVKEYSFGEIGNKRKVETASLR
jgi:hypothetical protein